MGLDMYLEAEMYVGGWDHAKEPERALYRSLLESVGLQSVASPDSPSIHVSVTVACWRKANAIHRWFVETLADGEDDCQRMYVGPESVRALFDLCNKVLTSVETVEGEVANGTTHYPDGAVVAHTIPGTVVAQQGIARSMLPTKGGCFFGCTDYDEGYLADLRDTIRQLTPFLDKEWHKRYSLYYRASW